MDDVSIVAIETVVTVIVDLVIEALRVVHDPSPVGDHSFDCVPCPSFLPS